MTLYLYTMDATPVDPRVAERRRAATAANPANAHSSRWLLGVDTQNAINEAPTTLIIAPGCYGSEISSTPGASAALGLAVGDEVGRVMSQPERITASDAWYPALLCALRQVEVEGRAPLAMIAVDEVGSPRLDLIEQTLDKGADLLC